MTIRSQLAYHPTYALWPNNSWSDNVNNEWNQPQDNNFSLVSKVGEDDNSNVNIEDKL